MGNQSSLDITKARAVLLVPIDGQAKSIHPRHLLSPPKLAQTVRVDVVAEIIESTIFHKLHHALVLRRIVAHQIQQDLGHFEDSNFIGPTDIVNFSHFSFEENDFEGASYILNEQEVAVVSTCSMHSHFVTAHQLVDEFGDQFLRVLMRAVHIVSARDDDGHTEGAMIGLGQELSSSFRCSVRIGGF